MKTRIIIICSVLMAALQCDGQEWIGNRFSLDTIVDLHGTYLPENNNLIKCKMQGDTFFFFEQQGFRHKQNGYQAVIHTLSVDNYEQTEIMLPLPECGPNKERYANSLWIFDVCFEGDYLLVTTQEELILYKRVHNQNYQVESTYRHHHLFMGYLHQKSIHFFEEDHDKGFKWFQKEPGRDSATLVRELPYEAPHIVQIQPNRYISHNQQSVFFLSTRFPRMETYRLDGTFEDSVRFNLPLWKAFEDEYIRKALSVPYGIQRIYAVKDDLSSYSYPKVIMPLYGDLLLLYMQYDTTSGNSVLRYAIRTEDGLTTPYLWNIHEDSIFHAALFPFNLFQGGFDKGNAADNGRIVQLTYRTEVSWKGKTQKQYNQEVDQYMSEGAPKLAYKVMRYHPKTKSDTPCLHPIGAQPIPFSKLPSDKAVLILHQGLECSGCVKAIYQLLEESDTRGIHIGNVYSQPIGGMAAFELNNQIRGQLSKPFSLYYTSSKFYDFLSPTPPLHESEFPCLVLIKKGERPSLFRASSLFTDDYASTAFAKGFLDAWRSFISQ